MHQNPEVIGNKP